MPAVNFVYFENVGRVGRDVFFNLFGWTLVYRDRQLDGRLRIGLLTTLNLQLELSVNLIHKSNEGVTILAATARRSSGSKREVLQQSGRLWL